MENGAHISGNRDSFHFYFIHSVSCQQQQQLQQQQKVNKHGTGVQEGVLYSESSRWKQEEDVEIIKADPGHRTHVAMEGIGRHM